MASLTPTQLGFIVSQVPPGGKLKHYNETAIKIETESGVPVVVLVCIAVSA